MNKRSLIIIIVLVVVIGAVAWLVFPRKKPNMNLIMSPTPASAKLDDNQRVTPGTFYATPGKHTITASFAGFASKTVTFTATQKLQQVSILLIPNSRAGYDYISSHASEQNIRQKLGGEAFNNQAQQLLQSNPIIAKLPFIGPANEYRVDYGTTSADGKTVSIVITYYIAAGKQDALNWITQQGYDPSTLAITYTDMTSSQASQPTNNPYAN